MPIKTTVSTKNTSITLYLWLNCAIINMPKKSYCDVKVFYFEINYNYPVTTLLNSIFLCSRSPSIARLYLGNKGANKY